MKARVFATLFPTLSGERFLYLDLNEEAARWLARNCSEQPVRCSPFLPPERCQELLTEVHSRLGAKFSFGGYLENRATVLKGSYLDQSGFFIHLGVDLSVPPGTPVACAVPGKVLVVDDDKDLEAGWGPRVIVAPDAPQIPILIFSHLQNVAVQPGASVSSTQLLGEVGAPPTNGNWWPHLHLQAVNRAWFEELKKKEFSELDGYGDPHKLEQLKKRYPDPLAYI